VSTATRAVAREAESSLVDGSFALDDHGVLRELARREGYLFLPRLLQEERIGAARQAMLATAERHGLLGGARPRLIEGQTDAWYELYADLLRQQALYELAWDPALMAVVRAIVGDSVIPHPCGIFRVVGPGVETYAKPAHQDARYIGTHATIWTAWIACGTCDEDVGGLEVLARSHGLAELPVRRVEWGSEVAAPPGLRWRRARMEDGDVLLFSSYTVHRAIPNISDDRLRLSADFRYQSVAEPFRPEALLPHAGLLSWEEVYRDWSGAEELRYYWRDHELRFHAG
jgi:ectoine hydroxylase-related dioxygenase (phytanoyl-CoA dioxygenase family)